MTKLEALNIIKNLCTIFKVNKVPTLKPDSSIQNYGDYNFITKSIHPNAKMFNNEAFVYTTNLESCDIILFLNLMHETRHYFQEAYINPVQAIKDNQENIKINLGNSKIDSDTLWTEQDAYTFEKLVSIKYFKKYDKYIDGVLNGTVSEDLVQIDVDKLPDNIYDLLK
jgi:hypothetical protein